MEFETVRAAKDYLAKRIIDQAVLEGAPLIEVERKMLYFSEDGGLSVEMAAVSEEFDRDYDENAYEEKIGGLVTRMLARPDATAQQEDWDDAAIKLCDGDNYLTILINANPAAAAWSPRWEKLRPWLPTFDSRPRKDKNDSVRLVVVAIAFSFLLLIGISVMAMIR